MKRLTVHLTGVPKTTLTFKVKGNDGKLVEKTKKILINTKAYVIKSTSEVDAILNAQKYEVTKHYLSNIN